VERGNVRSARIENSAVLKFDGFKEHATDALDIRAFDLVLQRLWLPLPPLVAFTTSCPLDLPFA
jgi:hypothetical protein